MQSIHSHRLINEETNESFRSIHELRQHALFENIKDYTLIVTDDKQMTEGISKERLQELLLSNKNMEEVSFVLRWLISQECKELDPWMPIESAPLNRKIILFNTADKSQVYDSCLYTEAFRKYYSHWKELPEDPKE